MAIRGRVGFAIQEVWLGILSGGYLNDCTKGSQMLWLEPLKLIEDIKVFVDVCLSTFTLLKLKQKKI